MALLDILKKAKKKVDDAIPDFNIRQKAEQAVKQVGRTISNIEQTSQRAGSQARQQVNRAAPVVTSFVKEAPKQIAAGLLRSGAIAADTGVRALQKGEDIVTAPLGSAYRQRLQNLRNRQATTENRILQGLKPLEQKKGQGLQNYLKEAYNLALPEIKSVKQATPLQRGAAVADIGLTLLAPGAGTAIKQAGKQGLKQIAKQYGKTALLQGAGGAAGAATMKDATASDIAKGALAGAVFGTGLKGAGDITRVVTPAITRQISKAGQKVQTALEQPKFQPGFASTKPKVSIEPKQPKVDTSYRSVHQIDTKKATAISNIDEKTLNTFVDEFKRQYGYFTRNKIKELNKLKKIISNPEAEIKIYRASPVNELNQGDWVTIDKSYANDIKRQNGGKVYEYTVKAKDLLYPKTLEGFNDLPSLNKWGAFQYNPQIKLSQPKFQKGFIRLGEKKGLEPKQPKTEAPVVKLATTETPEQLAKKAVRDIPGFEPAIEAKPVKATRIEPTSTLTRLQEKPQSNIIVKSKNNNVPDLTEVDVQQITRNTKKTPQEVIDSYGNLTSRISETTKKPIENIQASLTSFIRDPKKWDNQFVTPQKVLTSEELGAPKVEISQPEVKRPQVETDKVIREKVFKKEPEIKKPVIKLKTEVNPEKLARQAVEKATKQPISPEMPSVARVSQKADTSIPETIKESRLGSIVDDFYQSKKGDKKITFNDQKKLGNLIAKQIDNDLESIGSSFENVANKIQTGQRAGIKKLEEAGLSSQEANIIRKAQEELNFVRRRAAIGRKKIGTGDFGEMYLPQQKVEFGTEESLLTGFKAEKPGSEFKRQNKIALEELDLSTNVIADYITKYGDTKAYKAERIARTLQKENPDLDTKTIQKATSQFIKLQDQINSIKTKITLGIFGERRQVDSTNNIVDSAKALSELGNTLGFKKEIITGQPKGLTNGDRIDSIEINGQKFGEKIGLDQHRSAENFGSAQFTAAAGNRVELSNLIKNRLEKNYNLPKENIDYLLKRFDNLASDLPDDVVKSSVINIYKTAAKQQILQQLQKVDIKNEVLRKDVSDLTNQILREGSIENELSAKIVKGILTSQNALFRKANLSSTINELSDMSSFTSYYGKDVQLKPDFNTIKEFGLGEIDAAIEPYIRQISKNGGIKSVLSKINKSLNWYRLSEIYKAAVVASSAKKVYMRQGLRGDDLTKAVLEDYRKLALPVDAFTKTWLENYPLYTQYLTWGVRNLQKEKRLATGEITGGNLPATQLERIARNAYVNLPAKTIFWLVSNALKGTAILTAFGLTDFTGLTNEDFSGIKEEDKNLFNKISRFTNLSTTASILSSIIESYQKEQLKEKYKDEDYNPYEFSNLGEDLKKKFTPAIVRNIGGTLELLDKGYSENKAGRIQFEAPTTLYDKAKGFAFGKQNTEQAREEAGTTSIFGREGNVFKNLADMALEQLNLQDTNYKRPLTKEYSEAYKSADISKRPELFKGGKEFNSYLDNLKKNNKPAYDTYISTLEGNHVNPEYWKAISSGSDYAIFKTLRDRYKQRYKDLGVKYDPIYNLSDDQAKSVLQQKSTATGEDLAIKNILYKEGWYRDYMKQTKEYYADKKPVNAEEKKQSDRVKQWYELDDKYQSLKNIQTDDGKAPEWAKQYPLVYQSKLINEKYGFDSPQSKNFYKNNGNAYKAQKVLYDNENLNLINQMRTIEGVPPLGEESYAQATNIKNTSGKGGKGGKGGKNSGKKDKVVKLKNPSKSSRKYMTLSSLMAGETRLKDVPKIKANLRLIDLKNQPKPTILQLKRTLPKPVLRLKARQNAGIKPLTTQKIKVKYR